MTQRQDSLIAEIERDALDDNVPVATALRKCIVLGGKSGSEALRDWASRELKGYDDEDELPKYRVAAAPLMVDGFAGNAKITHQQFPPSGLPEFAREHIGEEVKLMDGVGSIEALLQHDTIKLMPAGASDVVRYMNETSGNPYQQIVSLYWSVSHSAIRGVLDQIRTALTQLVAELRATMADDQTVPSAQDATQALQVVVTGKRSKVNVAAATAPNATARAATTENSATAEEKGFWTTSRKLGAFVVGIATVAGTVVAIIQLVS